MAVPDGTWKLATYSFHTEASGNDDSGTKNTGKQKQGSTNKRYITAEREDIGWAGVGAQAAQGKLRRRSLRRMSSAHAAGLLAESVGIDASLLPLPSMIVPTRLLLSIELDRPIGLRRELSSTGVQSECVKIPVVGRSCIILGESCWKDGGPCLCKLACDVVAIKHGHVNENFRVASVKVDPSAGCLKQAGRRIILAFARSILANSNITSQGPLKRDVWLHYLVADSSF
ncbi:hypothetical protein C8R43DRAFT_955713 [Mycena crocata]|nr:hypothetical protein C8R43DRAFT_955713 [Mycena crocata]